MSENIFTTETPATPDDSGGGNSLVLGVVFKASIAGTIDGIRWYGPSTPPTGTPSAHLFSMTNPNDTSGTLLGSQNFGTITASAWNTATFSSPISISPNVPYCAQVFTPNHYDYTGSGQFSSDFTNTAGHLTVYAVSSSNNGRFKVSPAAATTFPDNTGGGGFNFFVDVVFSSGAAISGSAALGGSGTLAAGGNLLVKAAASLSVLAVLTAGAGVPGTISTSSAAARLAITTSGGQA